MINNNYLMLINKDNMIKENINFELVEYTNMLQDKILVEKNTLSAFLELKKYLEELNIYIDLDSGYRSIERQIELKEEFIKTKGVDYTKKYVAEPGYSEHHTGLAIDIIIIKDGSIIDDSLTYNLEEIKIIHNNLYKHGFILRYPLGKENITGYNYEPWHFRYINDKDIAKFIYDKNICLEEYINKFQ